MSTVPELQPDELEVLQAEEPDHIITVPVTIAAANVPVRMQDMPRKAGATLTKTVGTIPQKILFADHRRAQVRVISIGQSMLIAFSSAMAGDPSRMAVWPANVPFTMNTDGELWVASSTSTTQLGIITEMWATGE